MSAEYILRYSMTIGLVEDAGDFVEGMAQCVQSNYLTTMYYLCTVLLTYVLSCQCSV